MVVTLHWLIFAKPHMRTDALWIGVFYTPAWAGVWIFFLLGGYLAGRSFIYGRYKLTIPGIKRYYLRRIMRLAPPYYLFCLLCIIFFSPTFPFSSWFACLRIITFTYNGIPGATGLGATWYISTTMQLYILAPLVTIIIFKLKKYANIIFMLLLILGFSIRIISYLFNINPYITYTSFYGNIDIFFCGICINFMQIKINMKNTYLYIYLFILIAIYMILYFKETVLSMFIYQYILPSIYIVIVGMIIYNISKNIHQNINKKFIYIFMSKYINKISCISLGIYLWHSNIFSSISIAMPRSLSFSHTLIWYILSIGIAIFVGYLYEKSISLFYIIK